MSLKNIAIGRSDSYKLPLEAVQIEDGYNVRESYNRQAVDEIKNSIKINGIETLPHGSVEYKDGTPVLRAGHTRLLALRELAQEGMEGLYFPAVPVKMNQERRILDLLFSNNNTPLNQVEQGAVFVRLRDEMKLSAAQISEKTGKTVGHISNCIFLYESPEDIKKEIVSGKISASLVLEMSRANKGEKLVNQVRQAVEKASESGQNKVTKKVIQKQERAERFRLSPEVLQLVIDHMEDCDLKSAERVHVENVLRKYA
jgi:ParB/RepB/Spo0J family partition protein